MIIRDGLPMFNSRLVSSAVFSLGEAVGRILQDNPIANHAIRVSKGMRVHAYTSRHAASRRMACLYMSSA